MSLIQIPPCSSWLEAIDYADLTKEFEGLILDRLHHAGKSGILDYCFSPLGEFPQDWEDYFSCVEQLPMPAIWVSWVGAGGASPNMEEPHYSFKFSIVVACPHDHLMGSALYLSDIVALLYGWRISPEADPLRLMETVGISPPSGARERGVTNMFAMAFETSVAQSVICPIREAA